MTYELIYQSIHTVCRSVENPPVKGYKCMLAIVSVAYLVAGGSDNSTQQVQLAITAALTVFLTVLQPSRFLNMAVLNVGVITGNATVLFS